MAPAPHQNPAPHGEVPEARQQPRAQLRAGKIVQLDPWVQAEVPEGEAGPIPPTADGWSDVDAFGAWECALSPFQTLESVPPAFREKYAGAMALILDRLLQSQTEKDQTRALKWWLVAPQLLLREPKRGGSRGQGMQL